MTGQIDAQLTLVDLPAVTPRASWLPPDWTLAPGRAAERCDCCGHTRDAVMPRLHAPGGQSWPLIGNHSAAQIKEMALAVIAAHNTPEYTTPL